jgi:hypothetical protein
MASGGTVAAERMTAGQRSKRARVASMKAAEVRTAMAKRNAAKRAKKEAA